MPVLPFKNLVAAFFSKRSHDAMQQQQVITYIIAVALAVIGMSLHLFHVLGSTAPPLQWLSLCALAICVPTFVVWVNRRVSVTKAFGITALVVQAVQILKILYIAFNLPPSSHYLIVLNGVISLTIMMLLEISYLRFTCIIVGTSNVAVLFFVGYIINTKDIWQFFILSSLFTIFFMFMSVLMYKNVKRLQTENTQYHADELLLLRTLRLNRQEIEAYIALCRQDPSDKKGVDQLFDMLSEEAQRNVINAVEQKKANDISDEARIKEAFPSFTPMELEVARMVLRNMKLSQIIAITGKSESNISVVRSRIRKKLALRPGDDLRQSLLTKLKSFRQD